MIRIRVMGPAALGALLALTSCAPAMFHRGPAVTTVRVADQAGSKERKRAERKAAKAARETAKAQQRAAARAARSGDRAAGTDGSAVDERPARPKRGREPAKGAAEAALPPSDPVAELRARATQNPSEPFWPYQLARLELSKKRPDTAEPALRQALERDGAYAPALTALSRLYYEQGRHAEAIALLEPVRAHQVPLPPADRAAVLAGLAMHQAALGDDVSARATLGMLTRDERDHVPGVAAWLAVRDTSSAAARSATEVALRMEPKTAANHNNRGIALLRSGDPDGAAQAFERAIELDPSLPGPWYNLAILERWYRLDRVAAAKRFREYWTRSHADPDSLYAELGNAPTTPVAEEGPNR